MLDFLSVMKSLVITFLIVLLLQTKIGDQTAESYINEWAKKSAVTGYVQQISQNVVVVVEQGFVSIKGLLADKFGIGISPKKSNRLNLQFERSKKYQEEHSTNTEDQE